MGVASVAGTSDVVAVGAAGLALAGLGRLAASPASGAAELNSVSGADSNPAGSDVLFTSAVGGVPPGSHSACLEANPGLITGLP